ncbi:hypothetical protein DDZ14_16285 [Maritimibacter sp. 55A14]|uniref:hypothetical protein n=1 Tax=Maritimibacter sp. 55A14 TaxID=2174844 RepID=UPI000D603A94|nr:hypothetical protein [Maritimibacter sp. 55A14]PWE29998.1 hypothetical protein DDZ14_16285 [Maritimibacter sp. 55A14]
MTAIASRNISVITGTFLSLAPILKACILAAATSFLVLYLSGDQMFNSNAIYAGVFDLASIFTGFLATFYVFIVTKGNRFLEKIAATKTFSMVLRLLKFTIVWSVIVVGYSYAMMIVDPSDFAAFSIMHFVVFFWLFNVFMVVVNFTRCTVQFMTIAETDK